MPELPEVETVVRELNKKLKNRVIKSVVVNTPKTVAIGPQSLPPKRKVASYQATKFIKLLQGQTVLSVKRRAKLLIFNFHPHLNPPPKGEGSYKLLAHLKMTGQFIFEDEKLSIKTESKYRLLNKLHAPLVKLPCKHTHVVFYFTDGAVLYFNDVRKFGYLKLVREKDFDKLKEFREYGPEPLGKNFTLYHFLTIVKKWYSYGSKRKIKEFLMDSKVVAGIGNIYSDEILFLAGVRPERRVVSIKNYELKQIYKNIIKVLKKGIEAKGSSVGDFVRTDGSWGQMGKYHFVYGRRGQKCKKCGTIILSEKIGGRTASFCPKCQR